MIQFLNRKCFCTSSLSLVLCFLIFSQLTAQDFQTLVYLKTDSTSLSMDLFLPKNKEVSNFPLVLFMHGGGFSGGDRTAGHALGRHLSENGIACASISYTLSRKGKGFGCETPQAEKIHTMQLAASECWVATQYLLNEYKNFGFDTSKVFLAGSSAGAEAVLHAAFLDRDKFSLHGKVLDPAFKYAGMISGAGALIDPGLITPQNAIPILFFHGEADPLVPFDIASHHYCPLDSPGWMMMFGPIPLSEKLRTLNVPFQLYRFPGAGHEIAGYFFGQEQENLTSFINRTLSGELFYMNTSWKRKK